MFSGVLRQQIFINRFRGVETAGIKNRYKKLLTKRL